MNTTNRIFGLLLSLTCAAPLVAGCAVATDDAVDTGEVGTVGSASYVHFNLIDSDSYSCTVTDGHVGTTAVFTRSLIQKGADVRDRRVVQKLALASPVFAAANVALGDYGCSHEGEGWNISRSDLRFGAPPLLPPVVAYNQSAVLQWEHCDYNAREEASVTSTASGIRVAFKLTKLLVDGSPVFAGEGESIAFSGTCTEDPR